VTDSTTPAGPANGNGKNGSSSHLRGNANANGGISRHGDKNGNGGQKGFSRRAGLTLAALGVVYGDIGTSPLYAIRQSVLATSAGMPLEMAVMGSISLIFWALLIVVTGKYITVMMRANNKGEGGVLALAALAHRSPNMPRYFKSFVASIAGIGLGLFYGEALLTPAISVLSAVDGLRVEEPSLEILVLPLSLIIIIGLFSIQRRGTAKIGRVFGPVMVIWFATLAALGLNAIMEFPSVLYALNPYYGFWMFVDAPWVAFFALGAIVLCVTGVESLYADMGHFGPQPIRYAWLGVALPALVLNYFGQAAAVLRDPENLEHPFFALAPESLHYALVGLATVAAVIASQAMISGVYSITRQAVQLGQMPRMEIRHTSALDFGQIFLPRANTLMMIGVVAIVIVLRTPDAIASAYGVAVTGVMVITTLLASIVAAKQWNWKMRYVVIVFGTFALIDISFFAATLSSKFFQGGIVPISIALATVFIMYVWRSGRRILIDKTYGGGLSMEQFLERADKTPVRVSGTAVFITPRLDEVPGALLHNLKHNQVLHERVVLLRVDVTDFPFVPDNKRINVEKLGKGFFAMEAHYGFLQSPDVPNALEKARAFGLAVDLETTTFFVRRETLVPARRRSAMRKWRAKLFIRLYASALDAAQFYRLPPGRVVELGSQTEI
jgi:KUP system potassium uptake protein